MEKLAHPLARLLSLHVVHLAAPQHPPPVPPLQIFSVGTTVNLVTRHRDAAPLVNGRQTSRPVASGDVAGQSHLGRLFYVYDRYSYTKFLVDTGAEVSVIPPSHADSKHPRGTFSYPARAARAGGKVIEAGVHIYVKLKV